jgi:hypothetical protein
MVVLYGSVVWLCCVVVLCGCAAWKCWHSVCEPRVAQHVSRALKLVSPCAPRVLIKTCLRLMKSDKSSPERFSYSTFLPCFRVRYRNGQIDTVPWRRWASHTWNLPNDALNQKDGLNSFFKTSTELHGDTIAVQLESSNVFKEQDCCSVKLHKPYRSVSGQV